MLSQGLKSGENSKWLHDHCHLRDAKAERTQNGYIGRAISGSPKRGEGRTAAGPKGTAKGMVKVRINLRFLSQLTNLKFVALFFLVCTTPSPWYHTPLTPTATHCTIGTMGNTALCSCSY